ncbi:MAG: TonB-dependent receptor [Bacteroidales bacterium]|nr:TonB-dependent receptor [Bacteroidales bacterium]
MAFAQRGEISGVVTDASSGEGIPFASIMEKGTMNGISSDADGTYRIRVADMSKAVLVFSSVGYNSLEIPVAGRAVINIALATDNVLDDVIVVAYGTATKESFTGSATMVKSEDIEKKIATNVTSALAGTTPGVQMISSNGDPTSNGSTIRIRGIGSMSASSSPLIILDGAPYDGSISNINPQDIESMSVLKDAAASAIYGHRGANGVIIITTKKGKAGDATVKLDARFGSNSRLIPNYDVIDDPATYYELFYKRLYGMYYYSGHTVAESYAFADKTLYDEKNGGLGYKVYTIPEGQKLVGTNFKLNPNAKLGYSDGEYFYTPDDWYKETFHNSFRKEYNMSVSGANDRFNYYGSVGYLDDGGIISNSRYQRYTGLINADYQVKKWMKVVSSLNFTHSNSQTNGSNGSWGSSGNVFYIANNMGPIYPLYVRNADGSIKTEGGRVVYDSNNTNFKRPNTVGNAIRDNEYDKDEYLRDVITGKGGLILTPIKGLTLNANVSMTSSTSREVELGSIFGSSASIDGSSYVSSGRMFTVNQQYLANYKFHVAELHNFELLAGYEQYKYTSQSLWGYNDHLFDPTNGELDNSGGTSSKQLGSSTNQYMTEGFLTRIQYDFDGKYFLSASYRRDASSRFAKGHRWGNFWSLGGAWLISKEDFMQNIGWVDMLKLKVSYGQQGNDNLGGLFPYSDQYVHSYNEETGEYSLNLSYKGNENLTWETSKSFNAGIDFELFNNYLNGSFEVFSRKTEDLLYSKNVPYSAGNPTGVVPVNVGSIRNNGFEITLDGTIIRSKNFNWLWNVNLSHYTNKILSLDESVSEKGIRGSNFIYRVGGSLYQAYLRKYAGVDKETGEALYWKHIDEEKDADGKVTTPESDETTTTFSDATQYEVGSVLPKLYGGFGTSLNAYGFDFSVQCSFQLGGKYYDGSYQQLMWTQDQTGSAWHKDALKHWTPENTDTDVPRLDGDTQVAQTAIDRFLISSNYLSINNVTLGYTFPRSLVEKISLKGLRLYVAGENLAVFSARKGVDPRFSMGIGGMTSGSGINTSGYSAMRTITGGITLTF